MEATSKKMAKIDFYFENQGNNTFLAYKMKPEETVDTLSLGMLSNNKIPGLANSFFTQIDDERYIKYNVSAKITAKDVFSRAVGKKRLLGVFKGICNAILSAEEFMLDHDSMLIDMEYIFVDVSTNETQLICLPVVEHVEDEKVDLFAFFKNLMFSTQFDTKENNDYVAKILNYLNSTPKFSVQEFSDLLDRLQEEDKKSTSSSSSIASSNLSAGMNVQVQSPQQINPQPSQQPMPQAYQSNLGQQNMYMNAQPSHAGGQQSSATYPQTANKATGQQQQQTPPAMNPKPAQAAEEPFKANFAIPNSGNKSMHAPKSQEKKAPEVLPEDDGEEITLYYLLQHYNKENAAKYKAQKARKKALKEQAKKQNPKANKKDKKSKKSKKAPMQTDYSVPGAPNQYQVPGQMNTPYNQANNQVNPQWNQGNSSNPNMPYGQQGNPQGNFQANAGNNNMMQGQGQNYPNYSNPMQQSPTENQYTPQPDMSTSTGPNFGETTVLGGQNPGETTVLGPVQQEVVSRQAHLIRVKNKEEIVLDKEVFRIGKEKSFVDYFISDNTSISRSHANIISRNGKHFIVDTNSTNHSYVDDEIIQSNLEIEIHDGSKIRLADEEFVFHK